jgi:cell wall-associated NlpC family hydrolase
LLVSISGGVTSANASADQLSSLKAQAENVAAQIQNLGNQEDALSEQYDAATQALQTAEQQVAQAAKQVVAANASASKAKNTLKQEAIDAYIHSGPAGAAELTPSVGSVDQSLLRAEYVSSLTTNQADAEDQYHLASVEAATAKIQLEAAQSAAQTKVNTLNTDRQQVQATANQLQAVYNQDQGQIATLVAQIQAEQAAAARAAAIAAANQRAAEAAAAAAAAAAQARLASTPVGDSTGSGATVNNAPPPPGSGAAGAIAAAETRLGDPYVWGAAGPTSFDCSGLVQWAYAQVGISLPHYSGSQYDDGIKIPMSDLEPGDLVFFANPGDHVAIYIGGGQIIEAPHTGDVVHIIPMSSEFVLAVRIA